MSKSNPSDIKVAVPTPGAFAGLKALNLQVFVMIAAIIAIMLFFTWMTGRKPTHRPGDKTLEKPEQGQDQEEKSE